VTASQKGCDGHGKFSLRFVVYPVPMTSSANGRIIVIALACALAVKLWLMLAWINIDAVFQSVAP
jgi:hypothetical protein